MSYDIDTLANKATGWIGSIQSLIIHTIVFGGTFALGVAGFDWDRLLLILTTVVSLEAIYLAIFIQMTVNRNTLQLKEVEHDLEEIQEDVEDIQEDVDEIQKDVALIEEDVDEIQKDVDVIEHDLGEIQEDVEGIQEDVEEISKD